MILIFSTFCIISEQRQIGEDCVENDDCASRYCDGSFTWLTGGKCATSPNCLDPIPFLMTNVHLTPDGKEFYFNYFSTGTTEFQFLKNIVACEDVGDFGSDRIYGEPISLEEFKTEVRNLINDPNNDYDHVLYGIEGYNMEPWDYYVYANDFNKKYKDTTGYLVIPIMWSNHWAMEAPS